MSSYRVEQRRVLHKGQEFHFVSYEGAIDKASSEQGPPMWYLMKSGKRWQVMEQVRSQEVIEVDRQLVRWLDRHIFG